MEVDEEEEEGEEGGEEESEYEIEAIIDAKRGSFPEVGRHERTICKPTTQDASSLSSQGRMGYFVKWKGYPDSENSWVDEQDAGYDFTCSGHELRANLNHTPSEMRMTLSQSTGRPTRRQRRLLASLSMQRPLSEAASPLPQRTVLTKKQHLRLAKNAGESPNPRPTRMLRMETTSRKLELQRSLGKPARRSQWKLHALPMKFPKLET